MKFESTVKFQKGISYSSLAAVVLLSIFLYLIASKTTSEIPTSNTEVANQKAELQKKIKASSETASKQQPQFDKVEEKISENELANTKELEKKAEVKKTSSRELGFDIDFGSEQPRIIKNFVLPEAKKLGSGRIILKFRFSIRPDGSVSKVFPIMKGDPDLELETMNLLRKWRFEKLPATADQTDQKVEISFRPQ